MFPTAIVDVVGWPPAIEWLQPQFLHQNTMEYRILRAAKAREAK